MKQCLLEAGRTNKTCVRRDASLGGMGHWFHRESCPRELSLRNLHLIGFYFKGENGLERQKETEVGKR